MDHRPSGRIECAESGPILVYERQLAAPISRVWRALTDATETEKWIGRWTGDARPGHSIEVTWSAEDGAPAQAVRIVRCEPPRILTLASGHDSDNPFITTVELESIGEQTNLVFRQPMLGDATPAALGTGWEFYLDRLTCVIDGSTELPAWDDRYVAMQPHYEELQAAMATCGDRLDG